MANAEISFRGYDQAALDREYNNRVKVPEAGAISERWIADGQTARRSMSCMLDIPYGEHERQKVDIFPATALKAPILAFIHGGYWHMRDRTLAHFVAPFYVAAGVNFISIGYRLCPEVTVGHAVADARDALAWIHGNAAEQFGGDPDRLFVAGHSAGGHLAAMMCSSEGAEGGVIKGGCSISGLHDLEPIRLCYLNDYLHLDESSARALSPVALARRAAAGGYKLPPLLLTVGGNEGPEYLRQRDDLAAALKAARQPVRIVDNPGTNHFTACEAFCDPSHALSEEMLRRILAPQF